MFFLSLKQIYLTSPSSFSPSPSLASLKNLTILSCGRNVLADLSPLFPPAFYLKPLNVLNLLDVF